MAGEPVSPATTLVVLLGASVWPKSPSLGGGEAFANSARDLREYFLRQEGFGLPRSNLLDRFDNDGTPAEIDEDIAKFIEEQTRALRAKGTPARDLIVYYVGHGGFAAPGDDYFLALRATRKGGELASGLRMAALAVTLRESARHLRRYLILDCCFSAASYTEFQSAPLEAARVKTLGHFPEKGVALLCSSGARDPSRAPKGAKYTMFSGALIEVLEKGDGALGPNISLKEVGSVVIDRLRASYKDEMVRPEVHSPDQRYGDIAHLPIFPNGARRVKAVDLRIDELEQRVAMLEENLAVLQQNHRSGIAKLEAHVGTLAQRMKADQETAVAKLGEALQSQTEVQLPKPDVEQRAQSFRDSHGGFSWKQWIQMPANVRNDLQFWWHAQTVGSVWLAICSVVCATTVGLGFYLQVVGFRFDAQYTFWSILFGAMLVLCIVSLGSVFVDAMNQRAKARLAGAPKTNDSPWESIDPVREMRAGRTRSLLGSLAVESSKFEIASLIYFVSLLVLVASTHMPGMFFRVLFGLVKQ